MFNLNRRKGFSLIELLIVIAIILIIATIAVPNLNRARQNAAETAAIGPCAPFMKRRSSIIRPTTDMRRR